VRLSKSDIEVMADIHLATLKNDILPLLGRSFLVKFYTYINRSNCESIYTIRKNNIVVAACIVSYEVETLMKRVVKNLFFSLVFAVLMMLFKKISFFTYVKNIFLSKEGVRISGTGIVYIFVSPGFQNTGVGTRILKEAETLLIKNNQKQIHVKTINHKKNGAINFYLKNGFIIECSFNYLGREYLFLKKTLQTN